MLYLNLLLLLFFFKSERSKRNEEKNYESLFMYEKHNLKCCV